LTVVRVAVGFGTVGLGAVGLVVGSGGGVFVGAGDGRVGRVATGLGDDVTVPSPRIANPAISATISTIAPPTTPSVTPSAVRDFRGPCGSMPPGWKPGRG